MISALDTHQTVNRLTAAGLTGAQAEALTETIKEATDIDLANIATRTDVAEMRRELAELKGPAGEMAGRGRVCPGGDDPGGGEAVLGRPPVSACSVASRCATAARRSSSPSSKAGSKIRGRGGTACLGLPVENGPQRHCW